MNKLVVVTGGADGIGCEGIVRRLASDGYDVLACDIDGEKGESPSFQTPAWPHISSPVTSVNPRTSNEWRPSPRISGFLSMLW
jgi:nucleoside-diphosphate-sugar epimerase